MIRVFDTDIARKCGVNAATVASFLWEKDTRYTTVKLPCMYATGKYGLSVRFENTLYQISHNITLKNDEEVKVIVPEEAKTATEIKIKWARRYKSIKPPGIYQKAIVVATDIENHKVLFADTVPENGEATIKLQAGTKRENIMYDVIPIYHKMEEEIPPPKTPTPTPTPAPPETPAPTPPKEPTPTPKPEDQKGKDNGLTNTTKAILIACGVVVAVAVVVIAVVCACRSRRNTVDTSTAINDVLLT